MCADEAACSGREYLLTQMRDAYKAGIDPDRLDRVLDFILDALVELSDEIESAEIVLTDSRKPRRTVVVHTAEQVVEWLESLQEGAR